MVTLNAASASCCSCKEVMLYMATEPEGLKGYLIFLLALISVWMEKKADVLFQIIAGNKEIAAAGDLEPEVGC